MSIQEPVDFFPEYCSYNTRHTRVEEDSDHDSFTSDNVEATVLFFARP